MTNSIEDITDTPECIVLVGSNPEEAHPVLGMRLRAAVERGSKLIVVDPRTIGLSSKATINLKLRPGTNVAFANGMAHIIIRDGLVNKEFIESRTEGFDSYAELVSTYTPERVASICNIAPNDLVAAAHMYATAQTAPIIYCLGVTEHSTGTDGVSSLSNLAMICGKLGRRGCGVNPVRGQNNVQGACDMGANPNELTGYQGVADPAVIEKFENTWGVQLPQERGLKATECFPAMLEGGVRGLFIFGEDPVRTDPNTKHVIKALDALDFLVVDDLFLTETAKHADVVLPGRCFAEKEGTFTNTERRVQRVRKAVEGPQGTRLDTDIFTEIMQRMGYNQPQLSAAQIMDEIAELTPLYGGISHNRLDGDQVSGRGLQWPCTDANHPGTPIMHVGSFSRGRGLLFGARYHASAELPDDEFPFTLMTGRVLHQYNACAMTDKTAGLNEMGSSSFIEVNTYDAQRLEIEDGTVVTVESRRGKITSLARVSERTNRGEVWMPFHFQDGNSNWLTNDALDDVAKVPEFKVCAVRILPN